MGTRMKSQMALLSMLGLSSVMMGGNHMSPRRYDDSSDLPPVKIEAKPPKGTKQYFFNIDGIHSTVKMLKTECVFTCHARDDKNAERKFNNWKKYNLPKTDQSGRK
jgi:hypothetical protein